MRMQIHTHSVLKTLALVAGVFFFSATSQAQDLGRFADSVCDVSYHESIRSRAWIEAQREVIQHQNLIFKPDSVLEYTCFDSSLDHLANATANRPLFSMNDRWGAAPGNVVGTLTPVAAVAANFDRDAFNHNTLGGRMDTPYTVRGSVTTRDYECATMDEVWEAAKCMNFVDSEASDGFFTFKQYILNPEKRLFPTPCITDPDIRLEIERHYARAVLIDDVGNYTPWIEDDIKTYFALIYPDPADSCGGPSSILGTGLDVAVSSDVDTHYKEHVCLVPGCYYQYGTTYALGAARNPASEPSGSCVRP